MAVKVDWFCNHCMTRGLLFYEAASEVVGSVPICMDCISCGKPVHIILVQTGDAFLDNARQIQGISEAPNPTTESDPLDGFTAYKKGPLISGMPTLEPVVDTSDSSPGSIFSEAEQTINGPRAEDYGDATESFDRIAALWSAYLNTPISSADVAMMMSLLKMVRLKYSKFAHHDSFVDLLGYVGLAHKVSGEK